MRSTLRDNEIVPLSPITNYRRTIGSEKTSISASHLRKLIETRVNIEPDELTIIEAELNACNDLISNRKKVTQNSEAKQNNQDYKLSSDSLSQAKIILEQYKNVSQSSSEPATEEIKGRDLRNLLRDNTNCDLTRSRKIRKGKPKFKWFSERKDVSKSGLNMRESQEDKNCFVNSRPHCFKYQKTWSESDAHFEAPCKMTDQMGRKKDTLQKQKK